VAVTEPTDQQRAAFAAGRAAFTEGLPLGSCPHKLVAVDEDPQQLGALWVRGYSQARQQAGAARPVLRHFELKPREA
jgi:hypothetical protein